MLHGQEGAGPMFTLTGPSLLLYYHHMPFDIPHVVCLVDVVPRKKDESEDITSQRNLAKRLPLCALNPPMASLLFEVKMTAVSHPYLLRLSLTPIFPDTVNSLQFLECARHMLTSGLLYLYNALPGIFFPRCLHLALSAPSGFCPNVTY